MSVCVHPSSCSFLSGHQFNLRGVLRAELARAPRPYGPQGRIKSLSQERSTDNSFISRDTRTVQFDTWGSGDDHVTTSVTGGQS